MFLADCTGDTLSLNRGCLFTTFFFLHGSLSVFLFYSITIIDCGENKLTGVVSYDEPDAVDSLKKQVIMAAEIAEASGQRPLSQNVIIFRRKFSYHYNVE